ncbi:methylated-DNA-[protein]-cysteine S-methyltransferase [Cytobacillus horneckiae]|uniref:methylated-DNA--[protein]-cysteine S-methyltransferase n=1 Tax=Cytobacillus horneckiae TaxID=549687 RepID=UPI0019CFD0C7|nr:methylated-DNA--[protein]-cysteine S-methyltransferase [Cytobacillus horneckiae]MBN6884908.1 methylated-DNA--[protein]-cysteine S-methyltransferase [Cytobacillus horneckiae]
MGIAKADYQSPIGILEVTGNEKEIESILFNEKEEIDFPVTDNTPHVIKDCIRQLDEYFRRERVQFNIPYSVKGTDFQQSVWEALTSIPYGKTGTYKDIAVSIGNEKAVRAVGSANGKNKLTIVIPCHRIIGTNGTLTGYAGGMERKEWLLAHEKQTLKD